MSDTISPDQAKAMLARALVGVDPARTRGCVCRGAFIADVTGMRYMSKAGTWTRGIEGDDNWWYDQAEAMAFLRDMQAREGIKRANEKEGGEA